MAAGIQHTSSRGRGRMRRRAMAEINVTPFVDVMLVLLIVFMVTAPLLTVGVAVDLPKTRAPALGQDREPLSITVRRDGVIFLQKEQIAQAALVDKLACHETFHASNVAERKFTAPKAGERKTTSRRGD